MFSINNMEFDSDEVETIYLLVCKELEYIMERLESCKKILEDNPSNELIQKALEDWTIKYNKLLSLKTKIKG